MSLSNRLLNNIGKTDSMIREMFELGLKLKEKHGAEHVVDLSIGNPMSEPPEEFNKAIIEIISSGKKGIHRYMPNPGYPNVRKKIAEKLNENGYFNGITEDSIIMTVGAAGGMNIIMNTIIDKDDEVILLKPYFVDYPKYTGNHLGKPVFVDTDENFGIDINKIENAITHKTKALIINTPNNPSGRIYSKNELENLAFLLDKKSEEHNNTIYLLSDEPYREIVFGENKFYSPCTFYKNSFMIYSWSKSLSIPGERIGYVAQNPDMDERIDMFRGMVLSSRILGFVNAPALMQNAIHKIIGFPYNLKHYEEKRNILYDCLKKNGYELSSPDGAFYMFVKYPIEKEKYMKITRDNLLLIVPGDAFGVFSHFRISFCLDMETIKRACDKFDKISKSLR